MPPRNDSAQIKLLHDYMYCSHRTSLEAESILKSLYKFSSKNLPYRVPENSVRVDNTFVFRPMAHVGSTPWPSLENNFANSKMKKNVIRNIPTSLNNYDRVSVDNTYVHRNNVADFFQERWIPISSLGFATSGSSAELVLKLKNYELFKEAAKNGQFVANWNGQKVWKLNFKGNASVASDVVNAEKIAFGASLKTMKLVKMGGGFFSLLGVGISAYDANRKSWTPEASSKFALDCVMTGVAFIPAVGWVISGIYFLADGILGVSGVDWWHSFWDNVILPTGNTLSKAVQEYVKYRKLEGNQNYYSLIGL